MVGTCYWYLVRLSLFRLYCSRRVAVSGFGVVGGKYRLDKDE